MYNVYQNNEDGTQFVVSYGEYPSGNIVYFYFIDGNVDRSHLKKDLSLLKSLKDIAALAKMTECVQFRIFCAEDKEGARIPEWLFWMIYDKYNVHI